MHHYQSIALAYVVFIVVLNADITNGLIGYDCEDSLTNISAISLIDVQSCPEPEKAYEASRIQVQVIQRNEYKQQKVISCLVEVTRIIFHCGMFSHSSIVKDGLQTYIHGIGAEQCKEVHSTKRLKLFNTYINNILMNGTTTSSITLFGKLENDGTCEGVPFMENDKTWDDVVVTAAVKITTFDYTATITLETNEIHLRGGISHPLTKGYCMDSTLGETTWDYHDSSDCDNLNELFRGRAEKITDRKAKQDIIVVQESDKIFAMALTKKIFFCGRELWQTEHPRILILIHNRNKLDVNFRFDPKNVNLLDYVNTKFLYIEQAYRRDLDKFYVDTVHRRCLLKRELIKNRLLMAPIEPNAVSQLLQHKQGYTGRVLGEVLYIIKCLPKSVTIRRTNKCYNELPIEVNNNSKFLSPITRIIQDYAEEVSCNNLIPSLYYVDGKWIGLSPDPSLPTPPKQLAVDEEILVNFAPIQPLGSSGLYSKEEIMQAQRALLFSSERKAVENIVTRRIAGLETNDQGFKLTDIFNQMEMKTLAKSAAYYLWGWFSDLGNVMSGILGIYFFYRLVYYSFSVVLNTIRIYRTAGCGIQIVGGIIGSSLTGWILDNHQRKQTRTERPMQRLLSDPNIHFEPNWTKEVYYV